MIPNSDPRFPTRVLLATLALFLAACGSTPSGDGEPVGVSEVIDSGTSGPVRVQGVLFDDGSGLLICSALAESYPPQCPGPSIPIDNPEVIDVDFTVEGSIRWTDRPVVLEGDLIDGRLRVVS